MRTRKSREAEASSTSSRRYDIDALRVMATLLLILFHTGMLFNAFDKWHIQNGQRSEFVGHMLSFIHQWHMPLFFLLAGASTYMALSARSSRQYIGERSKRLFFPLLVGVLVVIPPQLYIERISTWVTTRISPIDFSGSFLAWYPNTFSCCYPEGNFSYHHLWFVGYLFVYSLVLLPLLQYLRRPSGRERLDRIAAFASRGGNIFWFALPIALIEVALRWRFPNWQDLVHDWANNVHYPLLFLIGFVMMSDGRFGQALQRHRRLGLLIGLVASAGRLLSPEGVPGYIMDMALRGAAEWCLLVAILGYGQAYLNRPSKLLRHASEIAYPFYIWHQTVIVVVGYFVVRWQAGIPVKYAAVGFISLVLTWLICEAIKLSNVSRVMFGLKAKRRHGRRAAIGESAQPGSAVAA